MKRNNYYNSYYFLHNNIWYFIFIFVAKNITSIFPFYNSRIHDDIQYLRNKSKLYRIYYTSSFKFTNNNYLWNNYLWNATIITIHIISYTTIFDISYLFLWLRILLQYFLSIIRVYMMAFNIFVINRNCIVYIILHHLNLPIIWNNYVWNSIIITIHIISYTKIFVTIFHIYFCG